MLDTAEAQFAIDAVREASLLARRVQREMVTAALTKDDRSPVTVADFAVQAVVAQRLAERLPGSTLIGEENASALRDPAGKAALEQVTHFVSYSILSATSNGVCDLIDCGGGEPTSTFWTLDPVDGTKGFLRREQYAVALALVRDGQVELGVLGCPELSLIGGRLGSDSQNGGGTIIAAARGQGAWAHPLEEPAAPGAWAQLRVSSRRKPAEARLLRSVEKGHTNTDEIGQLVSRLGVSAPPVPLDSQAKYAVLAAGEGDVLLRLLSPSRLDYREKIWDQAAGSIVVTEAGGRVTDLDGRPLNFSHGCTLVANRGILATNGHLHAALLDGLQKIGA